VPARDIATIPRKTPRGAWPTSAEAAEADVGRRNLSTCLAVRRPSKTGFAHESRTRSHKMATSDAAKKRCRSAANHRE